MSDQVKVSAYYDEVSGDISSIDVCLGQANISREDIADVIRLLWRPQPRPPAWADPTRSNRALSSDTQVIPAVQVDGRRLNPVQEYGRRGARQ